MSISARVSVVTLALAFCAATAGAQSQGPNNPSIAANDNSIGFFPWGDANNIFLSDGAYAFSTSGMSMLDTQYLKATGYGFSVPGTAVIVGIEVDIEKQSDLALTFDNAVRIVKGGVVGATDRSDGAAWPALADAIVTYGSPTDLWGETWTPADINAAGFGAAVSAGDSNSGDTCRVDHMPITVYFALCGDGMITAPEQCDDSNTANGDCCSSTCQFESNGSPCPDANLCNGTETCDGGGDCTPGTPLVCGDSDVCSQDSCDPMLGCIATEGPRMGCRTAGKGILLYKDNADNTKDKLVWKWIKGAATDKVDFAMPTGTTAYTLCLYAGTAALGDATIAGDMVKWKEITKGFKYKDKLGASDGITKALLKAGVAGKAKALVKGKGNNLPDLPAMPFDLPVTAQLVNNSNTICYTTTFATAKKNAAGKFKAKQ